MRYLLVRVTLPTCILLFALLSTTVNVSAQQPGDLRFGLFGHLMINTHSVAFRELPGFPSCCDEYASGFGLNGGVGVQGSVRVSQSLLVGLRIDYSSYGATLRREERFPVVVFPADEVQDGTIEHSIAAQLPAYGFEPILMYQLADLTLWAGPRISSIVDDAFQQREEILAPDAAVFEDTRRKTRNEVEGRIPAFSAMQFGATIGASYDIAINKQRTVLLQPQVSYFRNFTSLLSDLAWQAHGVRIGASLVFSFPRPVAQPQPDTTPAAPLASDPAPPTSDPAPRASDPDSRAVPSLETSLSVAGVDSRGTRSDKVTLVIDETISTRMHPLLPYVFFDENSSTIPSRYTVGGEEGATSFNPARLRYTNAVDVYRHVLDIIGYRMTQAPSTSIVLTGTTSSVDTKSDVAIDRATTVRDYLVNAWHIHPDRTKTASRSFPAARSNEKDPLGIPENQRVEIVASDVALFDPILLQDTMRTSNPPTVLITPTVNVSDVDAWTIDVTNGATILKSFSGSGRLQNAMLWHVQPDLHKLMDTARMLDITLRARDGNEQSSSSQSIPTDIRSLTRKRVERRGIYTYDRYDLILFDFDRATMSESHRRAVQYVKDRVAAGATITISGYTDRIGDIEHNFELSCRRARAVYEALGNIGEVKCMGEMPEHDVNTPEGRFYSRMVRIEVLTNAK